MYAHPEFDALSEGSFMQTKHLCVLIHKFELRVSLAYRKTGLTIQWNILTDHSKVVLLL